MLFEVNHSRDFESSLVITDGCRFCNIKETYNDNEYITYVSSHISIGSTARPKLFVINRILAEKRLLSAES